jgi:hypothetical protein
LESAAYPLIGEHLQKPRNAGSRPEAPFFNIPLKFIGMVFRTDLPGVYVSLFNWDLNSSFEKGKQQQAGMDPSGGKHGRRTWQLRGFQT